jgi:two-component system CheB/CheR fusion protein
LETDLAQTKEQLQNTIEEYETTTEELESSNEELLSMNEELQSKNEEIETSKEELQSVNEELKTTNQELKAKVRELREANSDLRNLMQATTVATLFLDRDLCVEWFTPRVRDHFNIREDDTGRPLSDLTMHVEYEALLDDARTVLDTLQPVEQEIRSDDGRWFLVRMRLYRTVEDDVEGVVVTFVDITDRKRAELEVREERDFVESLLNTVGALVVVLDTEHRIVRFNRKCETVTGYSAEEVVGDSVLDRLVPAEERDAVQKQLNALRDAPASNPHEYHWVTCDGTRRLIRWSDTTLTADDGTLQYIIGTGVDITRRRQLQREVISVSDKERQRIGQDLHDILASHLSGTAMMAQGLAQKIEGGQEIGAEDVREIATLIQDAGEQARQLSHSLMPLEVHGNDLLEGFENLARRREEMTDVTCTFETHGSLPPLDPDIVSHLYRIAAEAVNNAIKHGDPDCVDLALHRDDGQLFLVVQDDGVGISEQAPDASTLGLNMMRYRANLIGAQLHIGPGEAGGTVVRCSLPMASLPESSDVENEPPSA